MATIKSNSTKGVTISFIFIFCLILISPAACDLFKIKKTGELVEKRTLAELPEFETSPAYARKFEAWFNDNFGLREFLISWNSKIKINVFKASINPERVMIGKNGWLYFNNSNGADYIFRSYTHLNLMNESEMSDFVTKYKKNKKFCDSAGIIYLRGFFPQTQTIYPENLPFLMKILIRDTLSKADQVIQYLKKTHAPLHILDFRPALFKAKKDHQLYLKLDTHWNMFGAFVAYQDMFNQTVDQLGVKPRSVDEFKIEWTKGQVGDLAYLLADRSSFNDLIPSFTLTDTSISFKQTRPTGYPTQTYLTVCKKCTDKRRVMVFKDSYIENMLPFISTHFAEVIYIHWGYNQQIVNQFKPDIIIEMPVERYF